MKRRDLVGLVACVGVGVMGTKLATSPTGNATKGRLRQSVMHHSFEVAANWTLADTVKAAVKLGCVSVEGVPPHDWDLLVRHGLTCAMVEAHSPLTGMNNPTFWDANLQAIHERIDACADYHFPHVLSFTGLADTSSLGGGTIGRETGQRNCIEAFRKIAPYAERRGVTLLLEQINSRDGVGAHGLPGYQGDDLSYCAEIVRRVDSQNMKLLFDTFHVQVMHGDLLRRLAECGDILGHVQTAGNPGRCEIGPDQEINYTAIAHTLVRLGYTGYVGHEFMPTREPISALREAVEICTVL